MIGQTIQSRPAQPWGAWVLFIVGTGFVALAVLNENLHWALGSIPFLVFAGALWWVRPRPFAAHFADEAFEVMEPPTTIPYGTLEGLRVKGKPPMSEVDSHRDFPMQVLHETGVVRIPAKLDVTSSAVYRFFLDQFPPCGSREVNPILNKYKRQHEENFGAERIWTYRARNHAGPAFGAPKLIACSIAAVIVGILWLPAGFLGTKYAVWSGWGFLVFFVAGLWCGAAISSRRRDEPGRIKNWQHASLVISPVGLALVQGVTQGQMRWDELRDVQLRWKRKGLTLSADDAKTGIVLKVEGATFRIADIYDRPLPIIHERIMAYWRPAKDIES